MQELPSLLLIIAVIGVVSLAVYLILQQRKRSKRRAYFRDRDARVRQQWADLESMGEPKRRR